MEEGSRFLPQGSEFDRAQRPTSTPHALKQKSKPSAARTPEQEDILLDSYIEKEYKKIITSHVHVRRKGDKGWRRFAGLLFAGLSALCTVSQFLLLCCSLETELSPYSKVHQKVLLWGFAVTLLLGSLLFVLCTICGVHGRGLSRCSCCSAVCSFVGVSVGADGQQRHGQRRNWILMVVAGFLCSAALFLRFTAINFVTEYEAAALLNAEPLLVLVLAHFCVRDGDGSGEERERCGLLSILAALLTLGGAVTFAWPGTSDSDSGTSARWNGWDLWSADLNFGIAFALGSLLCHSTTTTILRIIRSMHCLVVVAWIGLAGLIVTLISFVFDGHLNLSVPTTVSEALHFAGIGALMFGALLFFVLALKYEQAAVVSVVLSLEIVFLYLGKLAFGGSGADGPEADYGWDAFRIIGGATLLISVVLVTIRKYLLTRPHESGSTNHHSRNRCWSII